MDVYALEVPSLGRERGMVARGERAPRRQNPSSRRMEVYNIHAPSTG